MFLNQNFNQDKYIPSLTCLHCGKLLNFKEELFNYGLCEKCFNREVDSRGTLHRK